MPVLIYEEPELKPNQHKELTKGLTEVACKVTPEIPNKSLLYLSNRAN